MRMRLSAFLVFCFNATLLTVSTCGVARAQDPLDEMYGQAVHSYFRGDLVHAEQLLNDVIAAGSLDPRAHYFRGLCHAKTAGAASAGVSDFERGAQLEIDGKKVVNVGKALERVQGAARLEIEKSRAKARLASRARMLEIQRSRYEDLQRNGAAGSSGIAVPPSADPAPSPNAPAANDPFNADAGLTKGTPAPMAETPKPATTPEADAPAEDVFDETPAMEPAGDTPAPADDDDPFANP